MEYLVIIKKHAPMSDSLFIYFLNTNVYLIKRAWRNVEYLVIIKKHAPMSDSLFIYFLNTNVYLMKKKKRKEKKQLNFILKKISYI